jgi:hypothetical protein
MKSPKKLLIICVIAVLISSCQSQSAVATSPAEVPTSVTIPTVTEVPAVIATETVTPIPVQVPLVVSPKSCVSSNGQLPSLSNPEIPSSIRPVNSSFGGGVVQSKEFTIELLLYCDSIFQPNTNESYYLSDIGGLAVYYNWRYDGTVEIGQTYGFYGIEPNIQWHTGQGGGLSQGHIEQGQSAGIQFAAKPLPDFSKKVSLRFVYVVQGPSGNLSGAVLSFDLQQVSDGLQPSNILVTPLSDTELKSMESIKSLVPTSTP